MREKRHKEKLEGTSPPAPTVDIAPLAPLLQSQMPSTVAHPSLPNPVVCNPSLSTLPPPEYAASRPLTLEKCVGPALPCSEEVRCREVIDLTCVAEESPPGVIFFDVLNIPTTFLFRS